MGQQLRRKMRARKLLLSGQTPRTYSVRPWKGSPSAAQLQVFGIPELFDEIFMLLDMEDLLLNAPRVNKTWNKLIASSSCIQRKLFFQPSPSSPPSSSPFESSGCDSKGPGRREFNPLLLRYFAPLFVDDPARSYATNPGLYATCSPYQSPCANTLLRGCRGFTNSKDSRRRNMAFMNSGASWRRMLPSSPPVYTVACYRSDETRVWGQRSDRTRVSDHTVKHIPEGLRMGDLVDTVYSIVWTRPQYSCERYRIFWTVVHECKDPAPEYSYDSYDSYDPYHPYDYDGSDGSDVEDHDTFYHLPPSFSGADMIIGENTIESIYHPCPCGRGPNWSPSPPYYCPCPLNTFRYERDQRHASTEGIFRSKDFRQDPLFPMKRVES